MKHMITRVQNIVTATQVLLQKSITQSISPMILMKSSITISSFLMILFLHSSLHVTSDDTITSSQILRDGDTLVSPAKTFELGFFSPGSSKNRYLGIWFKNITAKTVFWVANRDSPLRNTTSAVLTLDPRSGNIVILDKNNNTIIWSTNISVASSNPVLQLLDSGNLVIREANNNNNNYTWQSFDHPTDTLIPGMYFGWDLLTKKQVHLSSWKSDDDPSPGDFTANIDITGYPQAVVKRANDGALQFRQGPFNGVRFSGMPNPDPNSPARSALIINTSVAEYRWFYFPDCPDLMRFTLTSGGVEQVLMWVDPRKDWVVYYNSPADQCDGYATCGPHGRCSNEAFPRCGCLKRFKPRDEISWARSDWSGGCVRRAGLNCVDDVFLKYSGMKIPDTRFGTYNTSSDLKECEAMCMRNCSCTAYSNLDVRNGGSGCLMWFGDLVDIKHVARDDQAIYIRMAASELDSGAKERMKLIVVLTSLSGTLLLGLSAALLIKKTRKNRKLRSKQGNKECDDEEFELPMYDLSTVTKATDGFSQSNKLGEGGFGLVYKGKLEDGQEIAVKRLSETSSQGLHEFKNEVTCIAKLQHRNLVKLLGWCVEGEEKMLIYEYMSNNSLDFILFDGSENKRLDWVKRFRIINGVARGLLYLHQDSCLRIIHRDLKASNVLLDDDLNPKISDFGMARIFGGNVTEGNTRRVVGTYGYMSPEYVVEGFISIKTDVYSFGVLVLEIVSGCRNRGFHHEDHHHNLVGHAWILYKDGNSLELVDSNIATSSECLFELSRTIHVALLCVQQRPEDRPNMSSVVLMLGSGCDLPEAKEPGFFTERHDFVCCSPNECTLTQMEAR